MLCVAGGGGVAGVPSIRAEAARVWLGACSSHWASTRPCVAACASRAGSGGGGFGRPAAGRPAECFALRASKTTATMAMAPTVAMALAGLALSFPLRVCQTLSGLASRVQSRFAKFAAFVARGQALTLSPSVGILVRLVSMHTPEWR